MDTLSRYTIRAQHPTNGADLDVELIASSEHYAISRTRGTLFHRDRDASWLLGTFTVLDTRPLRADTNHASAPRPRGKL